jgi:quinoprotein relay system zinc metallohydrolase 2
LVLADNLFLRCDSMPMTEIPPTLLHPSRKDVLRGAALLALLPLLPRLSHAEAERIGVLEIAPGIFVHVGKYALVNSENHGDISNAAAIVGASAVAVIDTGGSNSVGQALREAIEQITDKPVRYVINTHMHPDHVLGNSAFQSADTEFVGHHKLAAALSARAESYLRNARERVGEEAFAGTKIVLPTTAVADVLELDLGGRVLTLRARPTAHTDNDLTIFDSATETLFLGDLLFADHIPTLDGSLAGWLRLIPVLKQEKAARAVPGHGPKAMPWPAAIEPEERYLETLARDVRAMIKDGETIEQAVLSAGQSERGNWKLFDDHHARNVTAAFTELEWE